MNQWHVAGLHPPHLAAMCVWEGAADFYRDATHHGGILTSFWANWYARQVTVGAARGGGARPAQPGHRGAGRRPGHATDAELAAGAGADSASRSAVTRWTTSSTARGRRTGPRSPSRS